MVNTIRQLKAAFFVYLLSWQQFEAQIYGATWSARDEQWLKRVNAFQGVRSQYEESATDNTFMTSIDFYTKVYRAETVLSDFVFPQPSQNDVEILYRKVRKQSPQETFDTLSRIISQFQQSGYMSQHVADEFMSNFESQSMVEYYDSLMQFMHRNAEPELYRAMKHHRDLMYDAWQYEQAPQSASRSVSTTLIKRQIQIPNKVGMVPIKGLLIFGAVFFTVLYLILLTISWSAVAAGRQRGACPKLTLAVSRLLSSAMLVFLGLLMYQYFSGVQFSTMLFAGLAAGFFVGVNVIMEAPMLISSIYRFCTSCENDDQQETPALPIVQPLPVTQYTRPVQNVQPVNNVLAVPANQLPQVQRYQGAITRVPEDVSLTPWSRQNSHRYPSAVDPNNPFRSPNYDVVH
ncbi:hypothetical protein MIR68_005614 [Amoeboaphelidium protococcarum]|nr:hypothetical protein MIR68_005614 [Amoeboaphelidium protococcarum]